MGDSHKRRHDSDEDEDFLGFEQEEEGHEPLERNKRVRKVANTSAGTPGKHHEDVDGSIVYDLQTEEEFIALYQNWDSIDKSMFPSPGPLGIPFEYGWRRELVFRATTGVSKEKGDVYYITPQGRKLRTRNEIQANLTVGLTMDNFSLSKVPLYLGPEYEIVRSAKMKTLVKVPSPREISPLLGKRVPKPKAPKGASPTPMTSGLAGSVGRGAHSKASGREQTNDFVLCWRRRILIVYDHFPCRSQLPEQWPQLLCRLPPRLSSAQQLPHLWGTTNGCPCCNRSSKQSK